MGPAAGSDPGRRPPTAGFLFGAEAPVMEASLPRGRHGLPRELVDRNQRGRLLLGAIEAVGERGYPATTVADITARAAVSRSVFYRHFGGKPDCLLASYDLALKWLWGELEGAAAAMAGDWPGQVGEAVRRVLGSLAADPCLARLLAVEIHFAGEPAAGRREAVTRDLAGRLRPGRRLSRDGASLPSLLELALVGAASSLIARGVRAGEAERLASLAPDLTELLLLPYLGEEEARRVARRFLFTASPGPSLPLGLP